jgi:hypothetical protein
MAAVENGNSLKMKDMCVKFLIDGCLIGTVCRDGFGGLVCPRKGTEGGWHDKIAEENLPVRSVLDRVACREVCYELPDLSGI